MIFSSRRERETKKLMKILSSLATESLIVRLDHLQGSYDMTHVLHINGQAHYEFESRRERRSFRFPPGGLPYKKDGGNRRKF